LFVDATANDFRLQATSPCINSGNNAFSVLGTDLDGNGRIAGGTVDMGAYEFQLPTSTVSYAWLQRYGFPLNGTADFSDPDGDGLNNSQEWRCGTDPTNAASALRLLAVEPGDQYLIVHWQSVDGMGYFLERSTNLSATPPFQVIATNLSGWSPSTSYYDYDIQPSTQYPIFYRIGVEGR
jgi:hypothetical protein